MRWSRDRFTGNYPGRSAPTPQPAAALTMATMPALTAGGRAAHASTTAARAGSMGIAGPIPDPLLPDLLPPTSEIVVSYLETRDVSGPVSPISPRSRGCYRREHPPSHARLNPSGVRQQPPASHTPKNASMSAPSVPPSSLTSAASPPRSQAKKKAATSEPSTPPSRLKSATQTGP